VNRAALPFAVTLALVSPVAAQTCVEIDRVSLEGVTLLDRGTLDAQLATRLGCLGIADLNGLLETVTLAYVDAGYIAARAYLAEQDVSDGELQITVLEGRVSAIALEENGVPAPGRIGTAFPGMRDRPLELRRLEQGLAQINRLPSSDATSRLLPGDTPGDTVVAVDLRQDRPWQAYLTMNSRGASTTGEYNLGATISADDLLGRNDRWTFDYQRSTDRNPLDLSGNAPIGNALSLSGSIPYGFWTFGLSASRSDYRIDVPAVFGAIENTGKSRKIALSVERLLSLSEDGRWDAGATLSWKDNENQILGTRIDTASRTLSLLDLSLTHTRAVLGGQLGITATLRRGLGILGAFDDATAAPGSPKAAYTALLVDATYARDWDAGGQPVSLFSRFSAQTTNDHLFGSEQFAIGGFSSVRGVRDSLLFGNRGAELSNTLSLPGAIPAGRFGAITPYLGLDVGHISGQAEFGIPGGTLASYTVGFSLGGKAMTLDAAYSRIFSAPDHTAFDDDGIFSIQAQLRF
jgi:hemolysin activation/secretion protein